MWWWCFRASDSECDESPSEDLSGITASKKIRLFSYNEMIYATNNFSSANKIGRGGFGTVFKGTLKNGIPIAAKVLSATSKQGVNEFLTEIDTITNVKHPNLVELIGCCIQGNNRILVYEFLENRSLDWALLDPDCKTRFDWSQRSKICVGTARGLTFLHEEVQPHIVHRDIKASNILLDKNFVPKIGDFGLAKLFPDNITHISTRVAGTTGYLAPEYAMGGRLTKKADIYSFGVVILEMVTGRSVSKATFTGMGMEKFLLEETWQLFEQGRLIELVDPNLKEYPEAEVLKYIKVALFCTQGAANRRPSMPQVLEMLSHQIRLNEKELTPPGLIQDTSKIIGGSKTASSSYIRMKSLMTDTSIQQSNAFSASEIIPR